MVELLLFAVVFVLFVIDVFFLFYYGVHCYAMIYLFQKNKQRCVTDEKTLNSLKEKMGDWPTVTIQLPIFNEYYVVERLLESAANVKYPKNKLEIQLLDDSTDETKELAAAKISQLVKQGFNAKHIHRTNRVGHKAGALKEGLVVAEGEFIAVFDADFLPAPEFLEKTVPYFFQKDDIGMVQTRWGHINSEYSLLTEAQAIGIDGHFTIEQVARNGGRLWMNFNGTAGIWKKECIYDAGNWQSDTLTEDFDLSYRAELNGWKFIYLVDVINPAELPATIPAYKSQQFRWCKGSIQTAVKLIPRILRSNESTAIKVEALTHLTSYSVHPLMILNILLTLPLLYLFQTVTFINVNSFYIFGATLSIGTFGPISMYIVALYNLYPNWKQKLVKLPLLTVLGTGIAINNTKAWLEALMGIKSSFIRTPKLAIGNKAENLNKKAKYNNGKIGLVPMLELSLAVYIIFTIHTAILMGTYFIVPFLLLYAAGFLYVGFQTLQETTKSLKQKKADVKSAVA